MADIKPQSGRATIAASATSVTITAGTDYTAPSSLSKSFIRVVGNNYCGDGDTTNFSGQPDQQTVIITNPANLLTSITFSRTTSTAEAINFSWQILEYTGAASGAYEFVVRGYGKLDFATTDGTKDSATISGVVDANDLVCFSTSQACTDAASGRSESEEYLHTLEWVSASTLVRATKSNTTLRRTSSITYALVEFTGTNWAVQKITHNYAAAATTETETITTVGALANVFLHTQLRAGNDGIAAAAGGQQVYLSSTSQLSHRIETLPGTATAITYIIEDVAASMTVQHISGTRAAAAGTEPDSWTETVSSVVPADSCVMSECGSTNTGNDTHYNSFSAVLTGATTVTLYRGENTTKRDYRFSVVSWPTATSSNVVPFRRRIEGY